MTDPYNAICHRLRAMSDEALAMVDDVTRAIAEAERVETEEEQGNGDAKSDVRG